MGCDKYRLNENIIAFSELNDDVGCLCNFANDNSYTLAPETGDPCTLDQFCWAEATRSDS